MTSAPGSTHSQPAKQAAVLQLVRGLCHLVAVAAVAVWGFTAWPLPLPGLLTGTGALVVAVLLWALFLSPRPVLRADRFGQSLIELLLVAAAVAALLHLGVFWAWPVVFGIVAVIVGYLAVLRQL